MVKTKEPRNFLISDGELKQCGDLIALNVARDLASFNVRCVTQDTIDHLKVLISDFDNFPTDPELLGMVITATENKNALVRQVRLTVRIIRNMAFVRYKGIGKYHTFGFKDMARLSDTALVYMVKKVVLVGTKLLSELASEGLTEAMLTDLSSLCGQLDASIDAQNDKMVNRDLATIERVEKANILFAEISRLASIGQSLYADTDPARYNDYLIYNSSGNVPSLKGFVCNNETRNPIAKATVNISGTDIVKITNADGRFRVPNLDAGTYVLVVSFPGYITQSVPISISKGETTDVTVDLVRE